MGGSVSAPAHCRAASGLRLCSRVVTGPSVSTPTVPRELWGPLSHFTEGNRGLQAQVTCLRSHSLLSTRASGLCDGRGTQRDGRRGWGCQGLALRLGAGGSRSQASCLSNLLWLEDVPGGQPIVLRDQVLWGVGPLPPPFPSSVSAAKAPFPDHPGGSSEKKQETAFLGINTQRV